MRVGNALWGDQQAKFWENDAIAHLGIGAYVLEEACYTTQILIKVMALFQGTRDSLRALSMTLLKREWVLLPTFKHFSYSLACALCTFSVSAI